MPPSEQADRFREAARKTDPNETDHRSQAEKFADLAREVGADEDEVAFDAALRQMRERQPKTGKPNGSG